MRGLRGAVHGDATTTHAGSWSARAAASRELDDPFLWMLLRGRSDSPRCSPATPTPRATRSARTLELCRELVVLPVASEGLVGLAAVAAIDDDLDRAARLAGAAAAHRYGEPDDPVDDQAARDLPRARPHPPRRRRLGRRRREGAALSFEDAIAYALDSAGDA